MFLLIYLLEESKMKDTIIYHGIKNYKNVLIASDSLSQHYFYYEEF